MVSNKDIKNNLKNRKEQNGYLVCDSCQGVYELQTGEKPSDFSKECECGGKLGFKQSISETTFNETSRNKKILRNGLIIFLVLFGLAIFIYPLAYIGMMGSMSDHNLNNDTGQYYDELATLKSNYNTLNDQFTNTQPSVDASTNQNTKTAFSSAKLDLVKANSDINDVESAISSGKPQSEIKQRINTAQSQLNTAKEGLAKVKGMI